MIKNFFLLILCCYRYFVSPFLLVSCRFYPTCSIYAADAINKHSIVFALYLIIKRICRCNMFFKGGYDPIL